MDWLGQNWLWIVPAIGAFLFTARTGGCGIGRWAISTRTMIPATPCRLHRGSVPATPSTRRAAIHSSPARQPELELYGGRAYYLENRGSFKVDPRSISPVRGLQ
jgi:hypothetical protein